MGNSAFEDTLPHIVYYNKEHNEREGGNLATD